MDIRIPSLFMLFCGLCGSPRSLNRDTPEGFDPFLTEKTGRGFAGKWALVKPVLQNVGILGNVGAITPIIVKKIPFPLTDTLMKHKYDMIVMEYGYEEAVS